MTLYRYLCAKHKSPLLESQIDEKELAALAVETYCGDLHPAWFMRIGRDNNREGIRITRDGDEIKVCQASLSLRVFGTFPIQYSVSETRPSFTS